MTDLATRIADVKRKAERIYAWNPRWAVETAGDVEAIAYDFVDVPGFISAASPELILAMVARIEELEKEVKELQDQIDDDIAEAKWNDGR